MASVDALPSHLRVVPGSVNIEPARFPSTIIPTDFDPENVATEFVAAFNGALSGSNVSDLSSLFSNDGFWRDHLALSWTFRTVQGRSDLEGFLKSCSSKDGRPRLKSIAIDKSTPTRVPQKGFLDAEEKIACLIIFFTLETTIGSGAGVARLTEEKPGTWRAFTFYTSLQQLRGHEENIFNHRPKGVEHGERPDRKNWAERRESEAKFEDGSEPTVLILGAGQAGLTIAARLKALGIKTLMVDKNARVGDNWRKRYHQLVLHDPVWYDHLPYIRFPPQWPIFTPKDKLAGFFESYVTLLELNVWMSTEIADSKWDAQQRKWTITVKRRFENGAEETRTLHPRHIVQATGHSGKMNMPQIKGLENFRGDRICHSSEFSGARQGAGKKAVVIGCCNSAHDIAQDFLEKGYDITMVQRSSTCVISSESITDIGLKGLYEENGPDVDDADLLFYSNPSAVFKASQIGLTAIQAQHDAEILRDLEKAGFKLDKGPDDAGFFIKYFERGGGYYLDVGASRLIADGKIKIKQGQEIEEILPHGVRFADGTELGADEIVFATGYQNMRTQTRAIFGDEVADAVGDIWGFNSEGEMRMVWQRSGHPGFWFHGGNLALCRYYSRLLALQIKGLEEGVYAYDEE